MTVQSCSEFASVVSFLHAHSLILFQARAFLLLGLEDLQLRLEVRLCQRRLLVVW